MRQLQDNGVAAVAWPLIDIVGAADRSALVAAWQGLTMRRLVVFVSINAAVYFFAARPTGAVWPTTTLAAAPGPATGDALRAEGLGEASIVEPPSTAPQFDSEALWQRLEAHEWRGASVLVVRGDGGRDWLAEQLVAAGASVDSVAAYRREPPRFDAAARRLVDQALAEPQAWIWLFSSSQAIGHLEAAAGAGVGRWGRSQAIATHPRIARRAEAAGFQPVFEAGPGIDAVVACLQSIGQ